MNEVVAHRMAPGHVAPLDAAGVVLKEKMILAVEEDEPVGVVEPVAACGEMKLWAEGLVVSIATGSIARCRFCAHGNDWKSRDQTRQGNHGRRDDAEIVLP